MIFALPELRSVLYHLSCICTPSGALENKSRGRAAALPAPPLPWSLTILILEITLQ